MLALAILLSLATATPAFAQSHGRPTIAVLPFAAPGFPDSARDAARERYRREIDRAGLLRVVEPDSGALATICAPGREARIACLAEVGRRLRIAYLVDGRIARTGARTVVRVMVVRSASGTAESILSRQCAENDTGDAFACIDDMARAFALEFRAAHRIASSSGDSPPSLSPGGLVGAELVGGLLGGIGGAVLGSTIGGRFGEDNWSQENWRTDADENAMMGALIGLVAGPPIGVSLVGIAGGQRGSISATMFGALIGSLAGVALAAATGADGFDLAPYALMYVGSTAGAMLGFNLSRRYYDLQSDGAVMLDIDGDRVAVGSPSVTLRASPVDGSVRREIAIVRMRF